MKKLFAILLLSIITLSIKASNTNDTVAVSNNNIQEIIVVNSTNTKGQPKAVYYIKYNDELISTSKTVVDKINLCAKYKAKCALILITSKRGSKRIALD